MCSPFSAFGRHVMYHLLFDAERIGAMLWVIITTFDEELWYTTVDVVKVSLDGRMTFVFRDGSTVEVPME